MKVRNKIFSYFTAVALASAYFSNLHSSEKPQEVSLTVYNGGFATVREIRDLKVREGSQWLQVVGVPSSIEPTSVSLETPSKPGSLKVLEQNYLYDLVNRSKLMERYIDNSIFLEHKGERSQVKLLSNLGGLIVQKGEEIHLSPQGNVVLPSLPGGLLTRPTLKWKIDSQLTGLVPTQIRYLSKGLSWKADYNLVMDKAGKNLSLSSWISLTNNSGASFDDAAIKLMAGDVNRVRHFERELQPQRAFSKSFQQQQVTQKAFAEYHLYELPARTTLVDRQLKQVEFMNKQGISSRKLYRYQAQQGNKKVQALISFVNAKSNRLGLPLPAGRIRMFQKDEDDNQLEFIGEDQIDHTPRNENVELTIGNSFDLVGESKRLKLSTRNRAQDETWEITLKNRKETESVVIDVRIPMTYGDWRLIEKDFIFEKIDAQTISVRVPLEPNQEKKLNYSIFYTW